MNMAGLLAWAKQPTTIGGLAAFAGTTSALLLQQIDWAHAVPVLVGAATSMLLPDNSAAKGAAQALAQDAVVLLASGRSRTGR